MHIDVGPELFDDSAVDLVKIEVDRVSGAADGPVADVIIVDDDEVKAEDEPSRPKPTQPRRFEQRSAALAEHMRACKEQRRKAKAIAALREKSDKHEKTLANITSAIPHVLASLTAWTARMF